MDSVPLPPMFPNRDDEHLKLLAVFHYVVAGLGALFACLPLIHVFMGIMMARDPSFFAGPKGGPAAVPPPAFIGYFFAGFGAALVLLGWGMAVCTFISGRLLAKRRKRMFSFVMAALMCGFFPFGTALGVFTIIVLSRESVIRAYTALESAN